ncbi:hypothetical protein Ae201684_004641 [Aphanomyces euteiches]|uniref:Uncharacterized protein n=1 Tax=Aphanomyces euteiches TaxID=100861 RepID=A0A6G0XHJ3_9STRA|nr:hypothetical protein Ae201684_004641 [Aphanomyces euteiches]
MMIRTMTTNAAATERRSKLLQSALRVQMLSIATSQGYSVHEVADDVEAAIQEATVRREESGRRIVRLGDENKEEQTDNNAKSGSMKTLDTVSPIEENKSSSSPEVEDQVKSNNNTQDVLSGHAHESLRQLGMLSSSELRKIVRQDSKTHVPSNDAIQAIQSKMTKEELGEVKELAASVSRRKMSAKLMDRVENLSPDQQKTLTSLLQKHARTTATKEVIDMFNYVLLIVLFVVVTMHGRYDDTPYKATLNMMSQLQDKPWPARVTSVPKTFDDSDSIEELHKYLQGNFYDVVYAAGSFDRDTRFPVGSTYGGRGTIGGYGELWGPIRIGQLRVASQECKGILADTFLQNESMCFPEYSHATESRAPFGLEMSYLPDTNATNDPVFISHSGRFYPGPTFNLYLPNQESENCDFATFHGCQVYDGLKAIEETKFFDRATRIIFLDMTVYNRNFRMVTLVRLYWELLPTGGANPIAEFHTQRLFQYNDKSDFINLGLEILLLVIVAYQLLKEWQYRKSEPSSLDLATHIHVFTLILFFVVGLFKVLSYISLPETAQIDSTKFLDFRAAAQYIWTSDVVTCFICFLAWIKLFYFLSFIPKFAQLIKTITKASKEIAGLMVIFFISLVGSSMAFQMTFGMRLYDYHTFWRSFLTLLQVVINKVEFENLLETNQVLGPVFFCLYVLLMIFVILNMCIVIITDAYIEAQAEIEFIHDSKLNLVSWDSLGYALHQILTELPFVGPYFFKPIYDFIERQVNYIKSKRKRQDIHRETVAVELEAVARLKFGGHKQELAATMHSKPSANQHSMIDSIDRMAVPVLSEGSINEDEPSEAVAKLQAAIAHECSDFVTGMKTKLALLENESKLETFSDHLGRWQELLST